MGPERRFGLTLKNWEAEMAENTTTDTINDNDLADEALNERHEGKAKWCSCIPGGR